MANFVNICIFVFFIQTSSSSYGEICKVSVEDEETSNFKEDIEISLETPPHELFTPPGSEMNVPFRVTNTNPINEYQLMVSFRERFTTSKRHVELVYSVLPKQLQMEGNSSSTVAINFKIPQYIISGFRVKVTIILTVISFQTEKLENAFYFTVSDRALQNFDTVPPVCIIGYKCKDSCTNKKKECDESETWTSELYVKDNITGLAQTTVASDGTNITLSSFTIGTVKKTVIELITSCCQKGGVIKVKDMAGNVAECIVGENPNSSMSIFSEVIHVLTVMYACILLH